MKKILLLLLLLVNLQITEDGILNIRIGGISAQTMLEETLDGVTVTGSAYTTCDQCHSDVLRAELEIHKKQFCPERSVECQSCHQSYKSYQGHSCSVTTCQQCGLSMNLCTCSDSSGGSGDFGGNPSGGNPSGGIGIGSGASVGQGSGGLNNTLSLLELRLRKGVKLIPHMMTLDKLHPQTRLSECVVRAVAFMSELQGNSYSTAYEELSRLATNEGFALDDLDQGGLSLSAAKRTFEPYCELGHGNYDEITIQRYIDSGTAVALVTVEAPAHMVTVIGYDKDFYYTAAGDASGKARIYPKNNLMGTDYIYLVRIKTPYRCKQLENF